MFHANRKVNYPLVDFQVLDPSYRENKLAHLLVKFACSFALIRG